MASALSLRTNDSVWRASISVTHDEVVLGRITLQVGQGLVERKGAMVRMPPVGVDAFCTCSSVNVIAAVDERPAERVFGDRESVMECAESSAYRSGSSFRITEPTRRDGTLAG